MESYRKSYSSRHHDSRHHKHHKHRHRRHHSRSHEDSYESHRSHQRHRSHRSSDDDGEYEYNRVSSTRVEKPPSPMYLQPIRKPATPPLPPAPIVEKPRERNWKLMVDPFIVKDATKVFRFDGVVPNDSSYSEVIVNDPRPFKSKIKTVTLPLVLPVPKFRVCISFYVTVILKFNVSIYVSVDN